ncbi:C45 family autoproteolytic acyltransferase/hydolase [Alteromonas oceanisediminis]|uniref:C45 family autoproteolytic acyltransferase/hydolase n=1 Tax=Alteromonas oceanisediminis TaxID=2836180 RepID=UPI001BD957F9|nr:C45 family peptidase [Alteromonas oceanisediminis]MBT0585169.1 hypothetical protein [Alteromonas oceanisediminis]
MSKLFKHIRISGSPFERGISYGQQASPEIKLAIETYRPSFLKQGLNWSTVIELGEKFAKKVEAYNPDMLEELKGISEGSGAKIGEIVALNARTELLYGASDKQISSSEGQEISGEGCTGAIALAQNTQTGTVIHGQNWDWIAECAAFTLVLQIEQAYGPDLITLVEAGTLARCGMNSDGIAVTGNFLKTDNDFGVDGIPAPFIRRQILMSSNFYDAMNAVITSNRSFSINVMISDGKGEAIDFETTPRRIYTMRPEDGLLVHSNHFLSPAAQVNEIDKAIEVTPDTLYRDIRVRRLLESRKGDICIDDFKEAFADKYCAPYAVCRDPIDGPGGSSSATLATVIMDVTKGEMHLLASPFENDEYQIFRFDKK